MLNNILTIQNGVNVLWWASGGVVVIVVAGNIKMIAEILYYIRDGRWTRVYEINTKMIDFNVRCLPMFTIAIAAIGAILWLT